MPMLVLFITVSLALIWLIKKKPVSSTVNAPDYAEQLSDWIEILNVAERVWAWGKRISWLSSEEFGDGACILTGIIDLTGTDPELKAVIDREFSPVYFDGNCLAAKMLVVAPGGERLILGSIDDAAMKNKITSHMAEIPAGKEIYVRISSDTISPLIAKKDRETFEQIWNRYA
jgi:hypothetical protein